MSSANVTLDGQDGGHGKEWNLREFTSLLGLRTTNGYNDSDLAILAGQMVLNPILPPDPISDGPDPEENLYVPAGYTYFGQFIDHDLTLDTTSTLDPTQDLKDPVKASNHPTNVRSPRFDLDCVYGNGPGDQPYMYVQADADSPAGKLYKDASMVLDGHDLPRASNHRALIGDKRNDENSIVNQIQQVFIKFHNQVVRTLVERGETDRGSKLFQKAREQVRWAYQTLILDDFLPRIIEHTTLNAFVAEWGNAGEDAYLLYKKDLRSNLPREFVVAAYRFGHSMVRTGYRLAGNSPNGSNRYSTRLPIFTTSDDSELSLVGFDPLPESHVIDDWGRFFPIDEPMPGARLTVNSGELKEDPEFDSKVRLQYAYKIDTSLSDPLRFLPPKVANPGDVPAGAGPGGPPSLALLNLIRGNRYLIQGGQAFESIVSSKLDKKYLVTRRKNEDDTYMFMDIPEALKTDTPLWFYILAEAQRQIVDLWYERGGYPGNGVTLSTKDLLGEKNDTDKDHPEILRQRGLGGQLGPVGGRIVAEVFYGLLEDDETSVMSQRKADSFTPIWGGTGTHTFARLLQFTGLTISRT